MNPFAKPDKDHPADYSNMDGGLMAALAAGDRRTLEMLAEGGFDFDKKHGHGKTALHWAVENKNIPAIKLLLEFGASPDVVDDFIRTPLFMAADMQNEPQALALLAGGADPSISNTTGDTPLHMAVGNGMEKLTAALLESRRAPLDVYNNARVMPIHKAAQRGNLVILKALLDAGSNPNLKDNFERTALHLACGSGLGEAAVEMVKHGAKLDAYDSMGKTPIALAEKYNNLSGLVPLFSYLHTTRLKRTFRRIHAPR